MQSGLLVCKQAWPTFSSMKRETISKGFIVMLAMAHMDLQVLYGFVSNMHNHIKHVLHVSKTQHLVPFLVSSNHAKYTFGQVSFQVSGTTEIEFSSTTVAFI